MTELVHVTCPNCQTVHGVEQHIYDAAQQRNEKMSLYCPNGHGWHYPKGDSQTTILRRERDRARQALAERDDTIEQEREWRKQSERSASAYKGQVTKIKKRVGKGVCPCCNRQFQNVHKHMESQHPEYSSEGADKPDLKVVGGSQP